MANRSYNRVILVGNLTRDPEIRYTPTGTPVCDIGLAVNDRAKTPSGEWVDQVTFVDVTLWERTAEVAGEYLSKGSQVLIEGRLKMDNWEGTDGQKRSKLKVVCQQMMMLGGKGAGAAPSGEGGPRAPSRRDSPYSQPAPANESEAPPPMEPPPPDDIPF
jgi:single-strand DNA-binding protein